MNESLICSECGGSPWKSHCATCEPCVQKKMNSMSESIGSRDAEIARLKSELETAIQRATESHESYKLMDARHTEEIARLREEMYAASRKAFFWERVDKGTVEDCWIWKGAINARHGYGEAQIGARGDVERVRAHRLSYEVKYGPVPDGLLVLHSCDNPPCVNPYHLRAGTSKENHDDMIQRGRGFWQNRDRRKTHCAHGHEFTEENTYTKPNGHRQCRTCVKRWRSNYESKPTPSPAPEPVCRNPIKHPEYGFGRVIFCGSQGILCHECVADPTPEPEG